MAGYTREAKPRSVADGGETPSYTVTLAAEVDYETTLEIHLCIDGKEFAEFVVDGSAAWGEFGRNIFLNTVVNRI